VSTTITKKTTSSRHPKHVEDALRFVRDQGPEGMAALEQSLMELSLLELHKHRQAIIQGAKPGDVSKLYRSLAKMGMNGDADTRERVVRILKARQQVEVEEYNRDGETITRHWRTLPPGHKPRKGEKVRDHPDDVAEEKRREEKRQRDIDNKNSRFQGDPVTFGDRNLVGGPKVDRLFDIAGNETNQGALQAFLGGSTIGGGILNAINFFTNATGKFQFAARAMSEFGPFMGARIAYNYFRFGGYDLPMGEKKGQVVTEFGDVIPAAENQKKTRHWAIEMLAKRLPGSEAARAGAQPPSEGFIIDRDGNILVHAVGRGNDHFLPFNTRHLRQLRQTEGVEYVRRRMFGGPTTEDLHAAMMMGADSLTVISNAGLFTLDLTQRSHGLVMEHYQILERYGELVGKKKNGGLTFDGYNNALAALQGEFPLHLKVSANKAGDWRNAHDPITPDSSFGEDLRAMLANLSGIDSRGNRNQPSSMNEQGMTLKDLQRQTIPGMGKDEDPQAYFRRLKRSGQATVGNLNNIKRFYTQTNQKVPDWLSVGLNEASRPGAKTPSTGGFTTSSSSQQKATPVQPPSGFGEVRTRQTDPSPPSQGSTPKAVNRLKRIGLDPNKYGDSRAANATLRDLERISDDQWTKLENDGDTTGDRFLDELYNRAITDFDFQGPGW